MGTCNAVMKNKVELWVYNKIEPAITMIVSIITVKVVVASASLILAASWNLEIISPTFLVSKNS